MKDSLLSIHWALYQHVKQNKTSFVFAFLFTFVCFGFMLTHFSLTIDEETWINNSDPDLLRMWLVQGRFGLYALDAVISPYGRYVPFLWDFVAVVLWTSAGIVLSFCVSMFSNKPSRFALFAFCAVFSSLPLVTGEIISFSMFNLQQALAMLVMAFSVLYTFTYFQSKSRGLLAISGSLLFVATSFFQAFPTVYIAAVTLYLLLRIKSKERVKFKILLSDVLATVVAFAAGTGLYYAINSAITTYIAPGGDAYFNNGYIGWNGSVQPLITTVKNCAKVVLGRGVVGGVALAALTVIWLCCTVLLAAGKKGAKERLTVILTSVLLWVSPFSLSLVIAMRSIVGRTYLGLPLVSAAVVMLLLDAVSRVRWRKNVAVTAACFVLAVNAVTMNLYFYRSNNVYMQDRFTAQSIVQTFIDKGYEYSETPVVFIGSYSNGVIHENWGPALGSFFSWDDGNIRRMVDFMRAEGYNIASPTAEQRIRALDIAEYMPCWPQADSVRQSNDFIVVKLSDIGDSWTKINLPGQ